MKVYLLLWMDTCCNSLHQVWFSDFHADFHGKRNKKRCVFVGTLITKNRPSSSDEISLDPGWTEVYA